MMKKTKFAKIAAFVVAGAMCVTAGALAACKPDSDDGKKDEHNWATTWSYDKDNHWHKCTDLGCTEIKDKAAHEDKDNNGKCDLCDYQLKTPEEETPPAPQAKEVVVYFYNYNDWTLSITAKDEDGEDVVAGGLTLTAVGEDHAKWYTVTIEEDANKNNFTIEIKNTAADAKETDKVTVSVTANGTLYISENGHEYADFAAAEANPPVPMAVSVVHVKAPDNFTGTEGIAFYVYQSNATATGAVPGTEYLGVWGTTSLHSDSAHDGWLAIEINLPEAKTGTALNYIMYDRELDIDEPGKQVRATGSFTPGEDVYIIEGSRVFYNFEDASKALQGELLEGQKWLNVHVKVIFGEEGLAGSDVYLYSWGTDNSAFGGFPGTQLFDRDGDGWYEFDAPIAVEKGSNYHFIINNNNISTQVEDIFYDDTDDSVSDVWIMYKTDGTIKGTGNDARLEATDVSVTTTKPQD